MRVGAIVGLVLSVAAGDAAADGLRFFEQPASFARDRDFNRTVKRSPVSRAANSAAQGNLISVSQSGRANTVILNVEQTNAGSVAAGAALNGSLELD